MPELQDGTQARTASIRVKLSPEMLTLLDQFACEYGMPTATMAAFAISDFISRKNQERKMARLAVMEATRQSMSQISGEKMEKALEAAIVGALKVTGSSGLMLDREPTATMQAELVGQ